jgi:hypothetical protein
MADRRISLPDSSHSAVWRIVGNLIESNFHLGLQLLQDVRLLWSMSIACSSYPEEGIMLIFAYISLVYVFLPSLLWGNLLVSGL